ncbi:MAG: hypothetical protein FWG25_10480 [Promicromonosporaceae bacterium]|nr:hypothetical protein [Promicromonosporaceae bacterium]
MTPSPSSSSPDRAWFARASLEVAPDLLGAVLTSVIRVLVLPFGPSGGPSSHDDDEHAPIEPRLQTVRLRITEVDLPKFSPC